MAKYYFDRYSVISTTTYSWNKYAVNTTREYYIGKWSSRNLRGNSFSSYSGYSSYSINKSTGAITLSGSKTIYDSSGGSVYTKSGSTLYRNYFSTTSGSTTVYYNDAPVLSRNTETRGSLIETVTGQAYDYKTNNAKNTDGYWWVRGAETTVQSAGTYVDTIVADEADYPADGASGDYWYTRGARIFPELQLDMGDVLYSSVDGWVRINGAKRTIEAIKVKIDGALKDV